jgi:hypothetical protein
VLFGGMNSVYGVQLGDTWEYDGDQWLHVTDEGPAPRNMHAMAYDPASGRIVLFGGRTTRELGDALGDTWEWDGQQWTQRATDGPGARFGAAMEYVPRFHAVVLVSGQYDSDVLWDDTWAWNGDTWTPLELPTGPQARTSFGMTYDEANEALTLFGGTTTGDTPGVVGDLWVLGCSVCAADCDPSTGEGVLDLFDFLCFLNRYNKGDSLADCDDDEVLDLFDFLCFVNAFNEGC